jgi:SanA protein
MENMLKKRIKNLLKIISVATVVLLVLILISYYSVEFRTRNRVFDNVDDLPTNMVGLVLGTTKYVYGSTLNPYYLNRIDAAAQLFKAGKVEYLLVSGDNGQVEYNEPVKMKKDLVEKGIPEDRIFLDYAGFRTLDSIVRSRDIFGQEKITVISQEFHNERAVFIALSKDIDAVGYNAKDVSYRTGFKTNVREIFARVKMMFDLAVGVQPKFLGEKITIE